MQDITIILMVKNEETGVLERELHSVPFTGGEYVKNMYAVETEEGIRVHLLLTTEEGREVKDWEFQAIYDCYDESVFDGLGLSLTEVDGGENPTWDITFPYVDSAAKLGDIASGILSLHSRELDSVYEAIKDMESEYNDM